MIHIYDMQYCYAIFNSISIYPDVDTTELESIDIQLKLFIGFSYK